jgi:molecular chaperone DnaJ
MPKDYYKTLGVSENANADEIKRAYKEMAKKYHPDLHKGDKAKEEKFKEANEAYRVLSDDKLKANYDRFGSAEAQEGFQGGSSGFDFREFDFSDINDLFGNFFGGDFEGERTRRTSRARRGSDLYHSIEITLEEAAEGITKSFILEKNEECEECGGTGAQGGEFQTCPECHGSGYVQTTKRTPFGMFSTSGPCRKCGGAGKTAERICRKCSGSGAVLKTKKIDVSIPSGIESGSNLRVSGEGEIGLRGGRAGDLYIKVEIKKHEIFERKGNDIYCASGISYSTAILGGEASVPTIDGKASIKIPTLTQSGTVFRLKGKGMKSVSGYGTGDEYVTVTIKVPKSVSKKEKEMIEELARLERE